MLPSLKYIDYLFFLFGGLLLAKIWDWLNGFTNPIYQSDPFIIDFPIRTSNEDIYNRVEFASRLATKIQSELESKNSGSLAIGINGTWGSGKSSFMNLINEKIDYKNRIVINFNPWRSSSSTKIIEDFFELLISELAKFDPKLSKEVGDYAKTLTKIDENLITKSIETIAEYILDVANKNENYDRINSSIEKLRKQIIIFIDDLDRLDIMEIIEVLRVIRNTANFNSLTYIVSYDKGYILEAVKKFNKFNYKYFLEKIFQYEFMIPGYDPAILRNSVKKILLEKLGNDFKPFINSAVDYRSFSGKSLTNRVITTHRDAIRLSNSILFEISKIKYEINFIDFYLIQLLKVKFPVIYKLIADHHDLFFIAEKGQLRLRTIDEKGINDEFHLMFKSEESTAPVLTTAKIATIFEEYIQGNRTEKLTIIEKDTIIEIINEVLKEKPLKKESTSKDYRSFSNASDFHKYFTIQTLESDFPAYELERTRVQDYKSYKEFIFSLINRGKLSDIQDRLEKISDFSDKSEWENHLNMLIDIGKYQLEQTTQYGINYKQIIDTLSYPVSRKGQVDFFDEEGQYIDFLRSFFKDAKDPYVFESNILANALTIYFPLKREEIQNQLFNYLEKYCSTHKEITKEFRDLHRNAVRKDDGYIDESQTIKKAQDLFVNYFKEYLKGSSLSSFIQQFSPEVEKFHLAQDWIKVFFPTMNEFEKFLEESENVKIEREHYEEFMRFYAKCKIEHYAAVEFHFDFLKPNRWS